MSIPDYQSVMLPLLKLIAKHGPMNRSDAVQLVADEFKLAEVERRELFPSGKQTVIQNRVGWARTYLKKAGLIDYPHRGVAVITARGKEVLAENPTILNVQYLSKFPEFIDFRNSMGVSPFKGCQSTPENAPKVHWMLGVSVGHRWT